VKCKICCKRLRNDEDKLCSDCFDFYSWKYKTEEGVDKILEQYEVQKDADKNHSE
jgi:hypothetical protein